MMYKSFSIFATLLCLYVVGTSAYAQEATAEPDAGWTVEERCIGEPTKPPEGWRYDGTILMTGYAGIHGVNADWDTPHVLAFLGENDIWGGALSPDGTWYASPYGSIEITETYSSFSSIDEIRLYNTKDGSVRKFAGWDTLFYGSSFGQIYWRDNSNFLYSRTVTNSWAFINPFTQQITFLDDWDGIYDVDENYRFSFAPDGSRLIYFRSKDNNRYFSAIWDINRSIDIKDSISSTKNPTVWKPNSTGFITNSMATSGESLALFDHDGSLIETAFSISDNQQFGRLNAAWSADSRYFAFITFDTYSSSGPYHNNDYYEENTLYILDTQEQRIINTCLAIGVGLAWSPDKHQLAFLESEYGLQNVFIFDMDDFNLYEISKHTFTQLDAINALRSQRGVIGWRDD